MAPPAPTPHLLDTNIIVHYVRDDSTAEWVDAEYGFSDPSARLTVSVVSEGEIRSLALQFGWGATKVKRMEEQLARAIIIPLEFEGVIEAYARIDAHNRKMGTPMGENDTWVAATAHATGTRLLTTDTDFDHLHPSFLTRDWIDPKLHR